MYGDQGLLLVLEARRINKLNFSTYNEEVVRSVLNEIEGCTLDQVIHMASIERNKRCLLAYFHHRMLRIKSVVWELSSFLDFDSRLSTLELDFKQKYMELIDDFKSKYPLDLNSILPPKDPFVFVRVVKECGEIVTEDGTPIYLEKNAQHYLKRTDVERLIMQGFLQVID